MKEYVMQVPFLTLLGGVGILLFGLGMLGRSISSLPRQHFRRLFGEYLQNGPASLFTGLGLTVVFQSSVAAMYLFVALYAARWLSGHSVLYLFMGANVGTTLAAALIYISQKAVSWSQIALFILGVGGLLRIYRPAWKAFLEPFLGYGFFFLGLSMITGAMAIWVPQISHFIPQGQVGGFTFLLALGAGFTLASSLQSSIASVLIVFNIAAHGQLSYALSAALIMGINLGISLPMGLAHLQEVKRVSKISWWDFYFNLSSIGLMLVVLPLTFIFFPPAKPIHPFGVAIFHFSFNLLGLLFFSLVAFRFSRLKSLFLAEDSVVFNKPPIKSAKENPELALAYSYRIWESFYQEWKDYAALVLLQSTVSQEIVQQKKQEVAILNEDLCSFLEKIPLRDSSPLLSSHIMALLRCMEHLKIASTFLGEFSVPSRGIEIESWGLLLTQEKKKVYDSSFFESTPLVNRTREEMAKDLQGIRNGILNAAQKQEIPLLYAMQLADECSLLDKVGFHLVRARKYYFLSRAG